MRDFVRIIAFFLYNSCLAILLTYGLFFTSVAVEFGASPTLASLVYATSAVLYGLSSLFMGFLLDRIGPSKTILLGGSLMASGLFMSSVAPSLLFLVLTYGVLGGSGAGSMWPTTSYSVFDKISKERIRGVTGVVSAGTAFGTVFFAPLEAFLISTIQWRQTFLVLGAIVLGFACLAATAASGSTRNGSHMYKTALRKARTKQFASLYGYYALGNAFSRSLVLVFIVPLLEFRTGSIFLGSVALSVIGAGSVLGRFASGVRQLSEEQISGLSFLIQGVSAFFLLYSSDLLSVIVFSLAFGIGYGGYIPQFALMVRKYFGMSEYGAIFGLLLTAYGVGAFVGPILEGFTLEREGTFALGFYLAALVSSLVGAHQILSYEFQKRHK